MSVLATVLAHQGGWDEILLIAGPIALIAGLLMLAKRRVDAATGTKPDHGESAAPDGEPAPETEATT